MSLYQANTALGRTKSLRVQAKSVTAPPPPTTSAAVATHIPSVTSHISLFLTNLRLLDLDQDEDWPDISPLTFSSKDAAGGQKKRIQCVEWALYNLFVLWDENEARNKLRPFYPPQDQVQSINLRAALLRSLEQAKRNGVLGRDAVIRKTMLDECKGDRFEEVLAVFSSAVLKKLVAERALNSGLEYRPTISENIALENFGYSSERTVLNGLILAHKASLNSTLRDKDAARERYRDFEELLALKERGITRRTEQMKAAMGQSSDDAVPSHLRKQARQILKTNWTGSEQWVETLLYTDTGSQKNGLLAADFGSVWSGVREGRLSDLEDDNTGLLEHLDQRVRLQRSRLEKWEGFRKSLLGGRSLGSKGQEEKAKARTTGVDLGFTAHQQLQPGAVPPADVPDFKPSAAPPEYAQLLHNMRTEFNSIGKPRVPDFSKLLVAQTSSRRPLESLAVPSTVTEPVSDLSEWEDEPEEIVQAPSKAEAPSHVGNGKGSNSQSSRLRSPKRRPVARQPSEDDIHGGGDGSLNVVHRGRTLKSVLPRQANTTSTMELAPADSTGAKEPASMSGHRNYSMDKRSPPPRISPERLPRSKKEPQPDPIPPPSVRPVSPTQAMADQILASMSNASPSPAKKPRHTLSLADRTRMSMTRTQSFETEDEIDSNLLLPSPPKTTKVANEAVASPPDDAKGEQYEDLVARTRRSMAGFEAAQQKAQLDRRRSQRKSKIVQRKDSYFPKVEEEVGDTSVVDELLRASQEDMEAVFKSRPKMRTSPAPSPGRRWDEDEDA